MAAVAEVGRKAVGAAAAAAGRKVAADGMDSRLFWSIAEMDSAAVAVAVAGRFDRPIDRTFPAAELELNKIVVEWLWSCPGLTKFLVNAGSFARLVPVADAKAAAVYHCCYHCCYSSETATRDVGGDTRNPPWDRLIPAFGLGHSVRMTVELCRTSAVRTQV